MVELTIHVKEKKVYIYNTTRVSNNFSRFCCIQKFNTMQFSSNSSNINSTSYGPMWRLFHRNLSSEILRPSHKCVYNILFNRLRDSHSKSSEVPIVVKEHFRYSMFCAYWFLLCVFGETQIKEIEKVQSKVSLSRKRSFNMFFFEKEMASGSCLAKHATYVSLL